MLKQFEGKTVIMNGTVRRLPVKGTNGSNDLIEIDEIFCLEARSEGTLIRMIFKIMMIVIFLCITCSRNIQVLPIHLYRGAIHNLEIIPFYIIRHQIILTCNDTESGYLTYML